MTNPSRFAQHGIELVVPLLYFVGVTVKLRATNDKKHATGRNDNSVLGQEQQQNPYGVCIAHNVSGSSAL